MGQGVSEWVREGVNEGVGEGVSGGGRERVSASVVCMRVDDGVDSCACE